MEPNSWIDILPADLPEQGAIDEQRLLKRYGHVYVMDNHRAALWCWRQHFFPDDPHNILHIDRHPDDLDHTDVIEDRLFEEGLNRSMLSVKKFLTLEYNKAPVFRYDNYLGTWRHWYSPCRVIMAIHHERDVHSKAEVLYPDVLPAFIQASDEERATSALPWIVNIDIDYFFYPDAAPESRELFSEEYVAEVCAGLKAWIDQGMVRVMTIATSPLNTGSADKAARFCERLCAKLGFPEI